MSFKDIQKTEQLREILGDKPNGWSSCISARAAQRALPFMASAGEGFLLTHVLTAFRCNIICWAAYNVPAQSVDTALLLLDNLSIPDEIGQLSTFAAGDGALQRAARHAVNSVLGAVDAQFADPFIPSESAGHAVEDGVRAATIFTYGKHGSAEIADGERHRSWNAVSIDYNWLVRNSSDSAVRVISRRSLWMAAAPSSWLDTWSFLGGRLLRFDPNFSVWIDWYERRIRGERAAFDIPGDKGRIEDKKILRRLAEATDEDFWGKGHEYVNATLKGWLDEARARVAPPPPQVVIPDVPNGQSFETVAETLLQQASPQAQITDGKLDAAPNNSFDKPQYSENLAELPSELLAYTYTILNSLPTNCASIVRNCFTGFRDELLVRGNRPIVNILKAMAASLAAELYGEPPADTSPDEWKLKDPREWEAGMSSMFGHFFKGYHDLIHHFPLDAEREALITTTPVDEIAASGSALTEPVDAVAALIIELGKQGFATDNIVRIVEAHQLYNRDVAQLPPPSQPSDAVTPKRRHVLQTAGFYLHTYSVLASTKELWPIFVVLAERLQVSINALLAFIK